MAANTIDFLTKQDWIDKFPLFIDSIDKLLKEARKIRKTTQDRIVKLRVIYDKVNSTDLSKDVYTNCMKTIANTLIWLKYRADLTRRYDRKFNPSCLINRGNGEWYIQKSNGIDENLLDSFLVYCFDEVRKGDKTFLLQLNRREMNGIYFSPYYDYLKEKNAFPCLGSIDD